MMFRVVRARNWNWEAQGSTLFSGGVIAHNNKTEKELRGWLAFELTLKIRFDTDQGVGGWGRPGIALTRLFGYERKKEQNVLLMKAKLQKLSSFSQTAKLLFRHTNKKHLLQIRFLSAVRTEKKCYLIIKAEEKEENSVKKSLAKMKNFSLISFPSKSLLMEKLCSRSTVKRKKQKLFLGLCQLFQLGAESCKWKFMFNSLLRWQIFFCLFRFHF